MKSESYDSQSKNNNMHTVNLPAIYLQWCPIRVKKGSQHVIIAIIYLHWCPW